MTQLVFLGKKSIDLEEHALLNTLGMGLALAGYSVLTLPKFSNANDALIEGYVTIDKDGVLDLRKQKIDEDTLNALDWIVYPDDALWRALDKRYEMFWSADNWTKLPTKQSLRIFTEAMLQHLGDKVHDNGSVGTRSR